MRLKEEESKPKEGRKMEDCCSSDMRSNTIHNIFRKLYAELFVRENHMSIALSILLAGLLAYALHKVKYFTNNQR